MGWAATGVLCKCHCPPLQSCQGASSGPCWLPHTRLLIMQRCTLRCPCSSPELSLWSSLLAGAQGLPAFLRTLSLDSTTHGFCELCQGLLQVMWPGHFPGGEMGDHRDGVPNTKGSLYFVSGALCPENCYFRYLVRFISPSSFRWGQKSGPCYSILAI